MQVLKAHTKRGSLFAGGKTYPVVRLVAWFDDLVEGETFYGTYITDNLDDSLDRHPDSEWTTSIETAEKEFENICNKVLA